MIAWDSVAILVDLSMCMAVVVYMNAYIHTDTQEVFNVLMLRIWVISFKITSDLHVLSFIFSV